MNIESGQKYEWFCCRYKTPRMNHLTDDDNVLVFIAVVWHYDKARTKPEREKLKFSKMLFEDYRNRGPGGREKTTVIPKCFIS